MGWASTCRILPDTPPLAAVTGPVGRNPTQVAEIAVAILGARLGLGRAGRGRRPGDRARRQHPAVAGSLALERVAHKHSVWRAPIARLPFLVGSWVGWPDAVNREGSISAEQFTSGPDQ